MTGAVLWDLDGTLVDSGEYHWHSWRDTLAAEDVSLTYEQFLASFGQKNDRILRGWLGDDATADRIARIGDAKEAEYRRLAREGGLAPLPGAAEWIARLKRDGWRQAIASSAPRLNVEVMLEAIALDRAAGIEAARRAGMRSIGVSRAAALDADVSVRSLTDLPLDTFVRLLSTRRS